MKKKEETVKSVISKLRNIAKVAIKYRKFNIALNAIGAASEISYLWNQSFSNEEMEKDLSIVSSLIVQPTFNKDDVNKKTVLFYDGFSQDANRGLFAIYVIALFQLGYRIVFLCKDSAKDRMPLFRKIAEEYSIQMEYYSCKNKVRTIKKISQTFEHYKPEISFLYTTPWDSAGIAAFNIYKGVVTRFQINLTDHAFWLGLNAFDYCIEFRNKGAFVSNSFRGIKKDCIMILPYYPYVDKSVQFEGFDNSLDGKKILFSGGAAYKTLGDEEKLYYKIVRAILMENPDVAFLYACDDRDTEELRKLISEFSGRAMIIKERRDLYQVLRHCTLYLNTYPLYGGFMTQYAALAGRLPLTLLRKGDSLDGLLDNREKIKVEFSNSDELIKEINHLFQDDSYRSNRETKLKDAIIHEDSFRDELEHAIVNHSTSFEMTNVDELNLDDFRRGYIDRFNLVDDIDYPILRNGSLRCFFPKVIWRLWLRKVKNWLRI